MVTGSGERRFHDQISWLMFLFSIFVIWVHSYNVDLFSGGAQDGIWSLADRIENFVSVGLGQIAVPGFFLLSSYLFFRNFSWDKLLRKWKSRVFSVLIPYVVWNLIYYLGYMAASRFLAIRSVVGRDIIPFSVQEIWRAVSQYAYAPIFWYLYQLIFLIIVSPMIYALVKNRAIGLFWIVGLVFAVHLHLDMRHPNTDDLLFGCRILCGSSPRAGGEKHGGRGSRLEGKSWNERKESCPRGQRWKYSQCHPGLCEKALFCRRSGGSRDLCILLPEDDGT